MWSTALHVILVLLGSCSCVVQSQSSPCSTVELFRSETFQGDVELTLIHQPNIGVKVSWSLLYAECFEQFCVNFLPQDTIDSVCTSDVTQTEVIVRSVPCNIEVSAKVRVTTTFSDGIRFIRTSAASNILYTGGSANEPPGSPPLNLAANPLPHNTTRISVTWDELDCFAQNADVTGYVLRYGELCSGVRTNITTTRLDVRSGTRDSHRDLGFLNVGRQYVFQVAATNRNGLGVFSNPVVITPGTTCEPPPTVLITTATPPTTAATEVVAMVTTAATSLTDGITTANLPNSTTPPDVSGGGDRTVGAVVSVVVLLILILLAASVVLLLWLLWRFKGSRRKGGSEAATIGSLDEFAGQLGDSTSIINVNNDDFQLEPTIIDYNRQLYVFEGEQVTIGVDFTGFPKPYITWFFNGRRVEPHYNMLIREDGSLFLVSVESNHAGTYDFIISNAAGSVEGCTKLVVYTEDKVVEQTDGQFGAPKIESNPIDKKKFGDYVSRYHALNDGGFVVQFQTLPSGKDNQQITVARRAVNRPRNRFGNVATYDSHRVILEPIPNRQDCQHDYINASYIDGYFKPKKYIATQAPLPKTIVDFWRIVWQERVQTIVMVTNIMEGLHKKCEQYWPETGSKECGPFKITLVDRQPFADYTIRTFNIALCSEGGSVQGKKVTHFHFTGWPDHGVPEYAGPLLTFLRRIRAHHKPNKGLILMHCCAGVGRTGTLISIDIALAQAMKEGVVDIPSIVSKIRGQRMHMVQTADQYTFIHDAVLEGLICGNTQIPAPDFKRAMARLEKADNKTQLSGYEIQFNVLDQVSPNPRDMMIATALRHPERNRSMDYLPSERWRVILKAQTPDYIHASYANGYKQRKGFIVAQAPMKRTIHDFWKMVYERECGVIVMLSDTVENGEELCYQYWPEPESREGKKYGSYVATTLDCFKQEGYIERTIGITHIQSGDVHKVTQFQLFNWTSAGICSDHKALVTVVDKVFIAQRRSGNKSIVVHGNNTVSRSAVFCSLLSSIECCKTEHLVDIFQMVKSLRTQKPGSIETVEQYRFVFEMMRLFLDSFTLYSNFK